MILQKGAKVKVVREGLLTTDYIGIIEDWYNVGSVTTVQVYLPDEGRSLHYNSLSLENVDETYDTNIDNNIVKGDNEMITGNYKVAMVKFVQGTNTVKEYAFALFDEYVIVDDYVLCDTANGYGVAKVIDIIAKDEYDGDVTKEIICGLNFVDFEQRKKNREEAKKLKSEMDKKMKEMQELALYEMMAEKSPELKEMLDAYKGLVG